MKKIFMIATLALIALSWGCNKEDKLWDAIGDLTNRLQALEKQVDQLNSNVKSLGELHKAGATVTKTEQDAATGAWTVTLSNGDVLTLKQGSDAKATIPVMAINADGNWTASYDNGATFTEIKRGTPPVAVKAATSNPLFRVDNDGFWQVSYDGTTYTDVLSEAGAKVNAFKNTTPTDSFFQGVVVEDNMLKITMLNGEIIQVPVVKDFFCIIDKTNITSEPVMFSSGAQKIYDVKLKGVDNTIISAPEGWKAKLSAADADGNASLTITAPGNAAASSSRATADNTKDVSILATSNKYATIAKIAVATDGTTVVAPTVTSVAADAAATGPYTLTFKVVMSADATGYRYIAQKSSETAPTLAKVISDGAIEADPTKSVVMTDLDPLTEYAIYVVAYKGTAAPVYSEAATKAVATTITDVVDYWESGVIIDGVKYDKNSTGAELLTIPASATAHLEIVPAAPSTATKVLFLDPSLSTTYNYTLPNATIAVNHDLIIVGRHSNKKPTLLLATNSILALGGVDVTKAKMALKNLTIDWGTRNNYLFNNTGAKATFGLLMVEDCVLPNMAKAFYYRGVNGFGIERVIVRNNSIKYVAQINQLFNFDASTAAISYKLFDFSNNLIYGASHYPGQIVNFAATNQSASTDTWNTEIKIKNNTIANLHFNNPMFRVYRFASLEISNNIFLPGAAQANASALYTAIPDANLPAGSGTVVAAPTYTFNQNIVFGGGEQAWDYFHYQSAIKEAPGGVGRITKAVASPMATADATTGSFIRTAATKAAGIGSSLEK